MSRQSARLVALPWLLRFVLAASACDDGASDSLVAPDGAAPAHDGPRTDAPATTDAPLPPPTDGRPASSSGALDILIVMQSSVSGATASSTQFCPALFANSCFEFNERDDPLHDFNGAVGRNMSLFHDAFDGHLAFGGNGSKPSNGNPWKAEDGRRRVVFSGLESHANDEVVALDGQRLFHWFKRVLSRGPRLREDNVFGGLSDVMIDQKINWCARCQVFKLHRFTNDCPERWVGPQPPGLVCSFDPSMACPPGTTRNDATRACEPPCPTGQIFDAFALKCVPSVFE